MNLGVYTPPRRMIKWPFSPFATVVMIVIPLFWPILGVILAAEVFCLLFWAVLFVVGNTIVLAILLVGSFLGSREAA